ncbi:MAG: aminomethyl-transferring glycine dehydrogenase [Propionibacteriaceae bacterium]|nr:aminomethyl-transferring glycine dehydrogenase [Propionibacteriaceae bacterium]
MRDFATRHIGPSALDQQHMLGTLGFQTLDDLVDAAIPSGIRDRRHSALPQTYGEHQVLAQMRKLAGRNNPLRSLIGYGFYGSVTPAVIRRLVLENPAWYTAYTPYQPEISQGRLEVLMSFQTMVADLTGLDAASASLLDEATAVAEAVSLARRQVRKGSVAVVDNGLLPQNYDVLHTRASVSDIGLVRAEDDIVAAIEANDVFAVVVQVPSSDGKLFSAAELEGIANAAHAKGALLIAACDIMALTLIESPASWGADIAVGSTQRFGTPLFFGGPHAAYIAVRESLIRQLPGRLIGLTKDAFNQPALRLALQTREQHIRREKATSNICTAQVLLAVVATLYAVYHGPEGLREIAQAIHSKAKRLAAALAAKGFHIKNESFFDTITVWAPGRAEEIVDKAHDLGFHLCLVSEDEIGISVGEDVTVADLARVARAFDAEITRKELGNLNGHNREVDYLRHPVFNEYHCESEFTRYVTRLAKRDFALDAGMIPLGSCTMKLNAASLMEPISYPGFANLHPFAPVEDAMGYVTMIGELSEWLADLTGYDEVSIAPNAGSQGEFAGLLAIRAYHQANGGAGRDICLLPTSAHGTNAASAAMAGFKVVQVATAEDGSVDLDDLDVQIAKYRGRIAAIMVTYPSTHGVYEDTILEIGKRVHAAGGQVYVDGANLNALMGLAAPGDFGADVSHLNLHKTFAMPHGGGGPGVGPVAVKEHLAPYLVDLPLTSAPFGSAGLLPISYGFLLMLGGAGLRQASEVAILNANYVAKRLDGKFPVLYKGQRGLVAHECILDLREITHRTHITVDDVAKRLIDYGFHAPTMSFPVAGTLMVEPTESESLAELDRFCDAMLAISDEIAQVERGAWPTDDNPLVNAPHPLHAIGADEWTHPYSRTTAAFPESAYPGAPGTHTHDKYWASVARVDGVFGDRNFIGTWPVAR